MNSILVAAEERCQMSSSVWIRDLITWSQVKPSVRQSANQPCFILTLPLNLNLLQLAIESEVQKFALHSSVFSLHLSVYHFFSFCQIDFPGQFTCLIRKLFKWCSKVASVQYVRETSYFIDHTSVLLYCIFIFWSISSHVCLKIRAETWFQSDLSWSISIHAILILFSLVCVEGVQCARADFKHS